MFQRLYADDAEHMLKEVRAIGAFADGDYLCVCGRCDRKFWGDKRCVTCLPCAVKALEARALPPERGEEVERLRLLEKTLQETRDRVNTWPLDDTSTCMCGSTIASHNIGSGHSPVSQSDYSRSEIVSAIEAVLKEQPPS